MQHSVIVVALLVLRAARASVVAPLDANFSRMEAEGAVTKPLSARLEQQRGRPATLEGSLAIAVSGSQSAAAAPMLPPLDALLPAGGQPGLQLSILGVSAQQLIGGAAGNASSSLGSRGGKGGSLLRLSAPNTAEIRTMAGGLALGSVVLKSFACTLSSNSSLSLTPALVPVPPVPPNATSSNSSTTNQPSAPPAAGGGGQGFAAEERAYTAAPSLLPAARFSVPGAFALWGRASVQSALVPPNTTFDVSGSGGTQLEGFLLQEGSTLAVVLPALQLTQPVSFSAGAVTSLGTLTIHLAVAALAPVTAASAGNGTSGAGATSAGSGAQPGPTPSSVLSPVMESAIRSLLPAFARGDNGTGSGAGQGWVASAPAAAASPPALASPPPPPPTPAGSGGDGGGSGNSSGGETCDAVTEAPGVAAPAAAASASGDGQCHCSQDWQGTGCLHCRDSQGCAQVLGRVFGNAPSSSSHSEEEEGAYCQPELAYRHDQAYKAYSCTTSADTAIYAASAEMYCSTTRFPPAFSRFASVAALLDAPPATSASTSVAPVGGGNGTYQPGPYCLLDAVLGATFGGTRLACRIAGCRFFDGFTNMDCQGPMQCTCPQGHGQGLNSCPQDTRDLVNGLSGSAKIRCSQLGVASGLPAGPMGLAAVSGPAASPAAASGGDGFGMATGLCELEMQGLPAKIQTTCQASSCGSPRAASLSGVQGGSPEHVKVLDWIPLVAAAPLLLVALTAASSLLYIACHRRLFVVPTGPPPPAAPSPSHVGTRRPGPVAEGIAGEEAQAVPAVQAVQAVHEEQTAQGRLGTAAGGSAPGQHAAAAGELGGAGGSPPRQHVAACPADATGHNKAAVGGAKVAARADGLPAAWEKKRGPLPALVFSGLSASVAYRQPGAYRIKREAAVQQPHARWVRRRWRSGAGDAAGQGAERKQEEEEAEEGHGSLHQAGGGPIDPAGPTAMAEGAGAAAPGAAGAGPAVRLDGRGRRVILDDASGRVEAGQMLGLVGPSGSGKSTLLGLLAGMKPANGVVAHGDVRLGPELHGTSLREVAAFVPQDDVLLPTLTVAETLLCSALLRLPAHTPAAEVQERVWGALEEVGLAHVASSLVGGASFRGHCGISGGERRRVRGRVVQSQRRGVLLDASFKGRRTSIAMELVVRPLVLILDEPTSGLDSHAALEVVKSCKQVAASGRVLVLSLHQPSSDIVELLDIIAVMASGAILFAGAPSEAPSALACLGLPPPPQGRPLAEHLIHCAQNHAGLNNSKAVVSSNSPVQSGQRKAAGADQAVAVSAIPCPTQGEGNSRLVEQAEKHGGEAVGDLAARQSSGSMLAAAVGAGAKGRGQQPGHRGQRPWPWYHKLSVLVWRCGIDTGRRPALLLLHLLLAIGCGVVVGLIFYRQAHTLEGMQNRAGALFFSLCLFGFTSLTVVDALVAERMLVAREVRGGFYPSPCYLAARLSLDALLLRTLPAALFCAALYPLTGLQPDPVRGVTFFLVLATFSSTVGVLAVCLAAVVGTSGTTTLLMNLVLLLWVLVGGFLVNPGTIPVELRWLRYTTPLYYSFEGLMGNELKGTFFDLQVAGFPRVSSIPGETYMEAFGLVPDRTSLDIALLCVFYAGFVACALAAWRVCL